MDTTNTIKTTFSVVGMTCGHCVSAVTEEVSKLSGVTRVDIELATGMVAVTATRPINAEEFAAAVDEAGYEAGDEVAQ